ncbi:MAG: hypothetical protein EXS15_06425 [Phycisphaerales bacterium]|nr:hypothetical protein [Phycisphaerales bacterium]
MNIPTILAAAFLASTAQAQLSLPSVFSDHMVLQRGIQLPVWGRAPAGQSVRIELLDAVGASRAAATAQVGIDGRWRTQLPSLTASATPLTLRVTCGSESIVRGDVLVGEVWLCCGQSNMEMSVAASDDGAQFAASLPSTVRCFTAPHEMAPSPRDDQSAQWVVATSQTAGHFTAVGAWFAARLQSSLDVPIGLLSINWGGSPAEAWTPANCVGKHPTFASAVAAQQAQGAAFEQRSPSDVKVAAEQASRAYDAAIGAYWEALQTKDPGFQQQWQRGTADSSSGWSVGQVPGAHGAALGTESLAKFDGGTWWRRSVTLPQSWVGRDLKLSLGPIDDSDVAWVNGTEVGRTTGLHAAARNYLVPAAAVRAGSNDVTVFVLDTGGAGGMYGTIDQLVIAPSAPTGLTGADVKPVSLAGEWRWKRGLEGGGDFAPTSVTTAAVNPLATWNAFGSMWNAMMAPIATYGVRGAIWYQGESNADRAAQYRELLPLMIRAWRESWRQGDFPFGIVQLAAFHAASENPVEGVWSDLRDAQLNTMRVVPKCGLAVTLDVGDANDIHPRNKKAVGERLAGWALAQVYGKGGEWSGPIFKSATTRGATMVIEFDHADGLSALGGAAVGGFAIAGADGKFEWATATIQGSTVVVSNEKVRNPTTVRYAWSCNPVRANLINGAGLPASPFATDRPTTIPSH